MQQTGTKSRFIRQRINQKYWAVLDEFYSEFLKFMIEIENLHYKYV